MSVVQLCCKADQTPLNFRYADIPHNNCSTSVIHKKAPLQVKSLGQNEFYWVFFLSPFGGFQTFTPPHLCSFFIHCYPIPLENGHGLARVTALIISTNVHLPLVGYLRLVSSLHGSRLYDIGSSGSVKVAPATTNESFKVDLNASGSPSLETSEPTLISAFELDFDF